MKEITRPVWVEVDLEKIKFNYRQLKKSLPSGIMVMGVVKADAYGHGIIPVSRALVKEGVDRLGVAIPEEGVELREAGFKIPIHILGEALASEYQLIIDYDLIPAVSREDSLKKMNELALDKGIRKKVHVKIDTGMGRLGITPDEKGINFVLRAAELPGIEIEGLMTHFATAEESNKEYTHQQWKRFKGFIKKLAEKGLTIPVKHTVNSAAMIDLPDYSLNMVRPGIVLYGYKPSSELNNQLKLKPALGWKARIIFLKELPSGCPISYGATYVTERQSRIATIPLGYADGYSRLLSNKGEVLIRGQRSPIRGRVCMDQFMVDVSDISDVKTGDEVILIGKQQNEEITATEMADLSGTINYEILCTISKRVPRVYINS